MKRIVLAIAAVAFFLAADTPKPVIPSAGETIEVSIINLDVVVTDAKGKRIHGLTAGDFQIYENGKPQPISNFAEYASAIERERIEAGAAAPSTPTAAVPRQPRNIVIFLEKFKLQELRIRPFFAALKVFVHKTVEEGDTVSVISYDGRPEVLVEPTGDVEVVEAALDVLEEESIGLEVTKAELLLREATVRRDSERYSQANASTRFSTKPVDPVTLATSMAMPYALEALSEMKRRVAAINSIIERMAGADGKKVLLLATRRLGAYSGADFFYAAGLDRLPTAVLDRLDNRPLVQSIISSANEAGVTIYPLYPTGLDSSILGADFNIRGGASKVAAVNPGGDTNSIGTPDEPGGVDNLILINEGSMLTEVAKKTGGAFTWGTAQIAALLPSIAEDVSDYYSIAYRVTPQRDGVPRQVTVKTRNRTYDVRTRREVVERTDDARMNDRVAAAVFGVVPGSGLEVTAEAGDVKKEKNDSVLPLKVRIAIGSLSLVPQDGKHAGAFSIYVVSANERGELSEVTHQTRTFDVPPDDIERAATGYFTYELDMRVNDSADRVAVGVLDEVSKVYGLTSVPIVR